MRGRGTAIVVAVGLVVGAAVVGWLVAPFGRPSAPSTLAPETTAPAIATLATLSAGDCIRDYESAWQATFDVTPCEQPHPAQLFAIVDLEADSWPGEEALRDRAMLRCQSPEVLDLAAAEAADARIDVRYPAESEWESGLRSLHCFAVGDLAGSLVP